MAKRPKKTFDTVWIPFGTHAKTLDTVTHCDGHRRKADMLLRAFAERSPLAALMSAFESYAI